MSRQTELNLYIAALQKRLRLGALIRGLAILALTALATTWLLVLLLNRFAFPAMGIFAARGTLIVAVLAAAVLALAYPLVRLTQGHAVRRAEQMHPELEQRLTTFQERQGNDPFIEPLAADTLTHTTDAAPATLIPDTRLFALSGAALACIGVLAWMIAAGPGYVGYGASLLWTGVKKDASPFYSITVAPGDVTVRRNADQLITAEVKGVAPGKLQTVQLFARYKSGAAWEPVTMLREPDGGDLNYQFSFTGLPESVEYYVASGRVVSPHYHVRVIDLPSVKSIQVTYQYPKWTGMKPVTEEHSGDLRAIEGTDAAIEIAMDRPLKDGRLTLDDGQTVQLAAVDSTHYKASIHMAKDGAYHVAGAEDGQPVRLSEDYFIATDKATPPEVAIERPGRDYRASPIEEVTVGVRAADSFGLNDVHLHYSVNGEPEREISMLKSPGAKNTDGSYTLHLEDFKMVPGDLVSLYATARNGHTEAKTDITFIQADPFEREFSQSQQSGGGGSGSGGQQGDQTEISKREKELIAATWKQQNDKSSTPKDAAVQGQFLSDAQQKLRDQVLALSTRIQSRDLSGANEEFTGFDKDIQTAAEAMQPSAEKLKGMLWKDAIPLEQKALQALLRAEATYRKIEVAFGQQQGGGGGGGGSAGRDLASLFDLELDTSKNQYETAQTATPAEQHAKDVESALEKLDALAKRQEELASNQHNPQQSFEERWQQEMLRREAEQLQHQMEQMAKNSQSGQQGSQSGQQSPQNGESGSQSQGQQSTQQSGQQSGSQGGSQSGSSGSKAQDQRVQQAVSRLRQAGEAMKRSTGAQASANPQASADAARQAAEKLRDAASAFGGEQQQLASGKLGELGRQADSLVSQERAQADRIQKLAAQAGADATNEATIRERIAERNRLAAERQQLSNDLSGLQKNLRDQARSMASTQPGTAKALRDAVSEMDQSDLDNHVQRTADWLRRGINPNSNGTEGEIAQELAKLDQQIRQAQQGMSSEKPGQQRGPGGRSEETAALGQVERLRSQLQSQMQSASGRNGQQSGQSGQDGQPGQRGQQQGGQQPGQSSSQQGGQPGQNGQRGDLGGDRGGDTRAGGQGGGGGTAWNNVNTGNNTYGQGSARLNPADASPADTERAYRQSMQELDQLRHLVQNDPKVAAEVAELARQMQKLDPSRFPGNPAMVEQMHREVLSQVDKLELEMHRQAATGARTGKPSTIPAGYQDSVADYYKRLSAKP